MVSREEWAGRLHRALRVANKIKSYIPFLRSIHFNFIFLHYAYIIGVTIVMSVVLYPGGQMAYIDALFFSAGSATQSGLNTVDVNEIHTYQQVGLWMGSMIANPIVIHSFVVFVRLYWFERRFQHVVRDAKALRRSRSRSRTRTEGRTNEGLELDHDREERGVRGKQIVVLRNPAGLAGKKMETPEVVKPGSDSTASSTTSGTPNGDGNGQSSSGPDQNSDERDNGTNVLDFSRNHEAYSGVRAPARLSPEHHIAFLENQRNQTGTLRIPSPREFDRGGMPQSLDDDADGAELGRNVTAQSEHRRQQSQDMPNSGAGNANPTPGQHITIDEPDMPRFRTRTGTFARVRTAADDADGEIEPTPSRPQMAKQRRGTLTSIFRTASQNQDIEQAPYLSWEPTIGRNSAFIDLTEAQRDELGGIEYRALKTLAVILMSYFFFFHFLGIVCLVPWIMTTRWGEIPPQYSIGRPWWAIFSAGSSFNDQGFTLTPNSMLSFNDAIFPVLLMTFLIIIGNTGFPCMLRLIIWILSKLVPKGSAVWEELHFLLDHPRRCFTLLFPSDATWWLFGVLVILNGVDLIFFIILDLNDPSVTSIPGGIRFVDGLFQASATRTAGLSVVSIGDLHPAIQVSYMIMMYISVFPIAISMRRTNVYEERSLGIYGTQGVEEDDGLVKEPSYVAAHLRKQLGFDLWYVFLGLFVIAIIEGSRIENTKDSAFTMFAILFEIISAYGTVGLSLGYPTANTSFSGQFKVLSKLVVIAMMIRGRHRGLPYALDRAVLLPSESLNRKELADANRRGRRRNSGLSGMSAVTGQTGTGLFRPETGLSSARSGGGGNGTGGQGGDETANYLRSDVGNVVQRLAPQREGVES